MPIHRLLPALTLTLLATIGCADDGGPLFNNEGNQEISCLQHQSEPPGSRYTDSERRDTAEVLTVLRYYTAHGTKPYCDSAPPTEADRAWAELYVQQGADRTNVAPILDGR
ncbi:MAG: hypothetical protein ACRDTT_15025 [Pseudonocardiaceae bacterium]